MGDERNLQDLSSDDRQKQLITISSGWLLLGVQSQILQNIASEVEKIKVVKKRKSRRSRRNRRCWQSAFLERRRERGAATVLFDELLVESHQYFKDFVRLSASDFELLLQMIGPSIKRQETTMRKPISEKERLVLTLRFLATGDSYKTLWESHRISVSAIGPIIADTCRAIYDALAPQHLVLPSTKDEWLKIADSFSHIWNFPNCVGAIDGKHVVLQAPIHSGSAYYNYKNNHSIVLMAVVNAHYNFYYVDIGCQGRISDGGVFRNCSLSTLLHTDSLNLPDPAPLHERYSTRSVLYVMIGDDAFPLKPNLMKPFKGTTIPGSRKRSFNYRICRARRVVENAFGILAAVFRVFRRPLAVRPETAVEITKACVVLHNFMRRNKKARSCYCPAGLADDVDPVTGEVREGSFRSEPQSEGLVKARGRKGNDSNAAKEVRQAFAAFLHSNVGSIPVQFKDHSMS